MKHLNPFILLVSAVAFAMGHYIGEVTGKLDGHLAFSGALRVLDGFSVDNSDNEMTRALAIHLEDEANRMGELIDNPTGRIVFAMRLDNPAEKEILAYIQKYETNEVLLRLK